MQSRDGRQLLFLLFLLLLLGGRGEGEGPVVPWWGTGLPDTEGPGHRFLSPISPPLSGLGEGVLLLGGDLGVRELLLGGVLSGDLSLVLCTESLLELE